ncbi:MAG TPA: hypothetical protein PK916_10425 [Bacteroidota bacterium]|mgnify:FL=1|nr:hypothetical protein [Bacteroidota bacterium]
MNALLASLAMCVLLSGPTHAGSDKHTALATAPAQRTVQFSSSEVDRLRSVISRNLEHRIPGIKANTMQLLIDLRVGHPEVDLDFAVIPVMRILKQDTTEEMRMLAAVALYHLNTRTGRFAVERRAEFDESERVARHCARIARFWDHNRMEFAPAPQGREFLATDAGNPRPE